MNCKLHLANTIVIFCLFISAQTFGQGKHEIKVMTFNIRLDHAGDGIHNWRYRKSAAAGLIEREAVDIVGTQEVFKNQLDDILNAAPDYASVGVGRFDGKEAGEYSAIFYRKDRFTPEKSGNFWLSETPEKEGSKGWDAACERIVTWAVFSDRLSNTKVLVMNTHFDHVGSQARKNSAKLLLAKASELANGLPVIITGDFNGTSESEPLQIMLQSGWLSDTHAKAQTVEGPEWSFHDFGRLPLADRPLIDFVFVSPQLEVSSYHNIFREIDSTFYSDHNPILVVLNLKSE